MENRVSDAGGRAPLVCLQRAGVRRGDRWLIRGVDLCVRPGEIVTLIGPNGSGKSTTVKVALGLIRPDEGTAGQRPGLVVGYVPQKISVDWTLPLSVDRFMRLTSAVPQADIDRALAATAVSHLRRAEIRNLSGGEFQRVLLARAMARRPALMVLDEPVQGVDFGGEIALYELIRQIRDETGCGILLVSHDLHVVMAATDHVICLNGHVCCEGAPAAVASSAEYLQLFGRSPALAVYEHQHDHVHLPDGRVRHRDGTITGDCHPADGHHHHDPHHHAGHGRDGEAGRSRQGEERADA